jgi:VIT1/CCC1 family predicted Fe2+/Mn2+ transporter
MAEEKKKDIWDKLSSLAALFASVLVPIVIAVIGHSYTSALKESENRVKYTELAISILKDKPEKETNDVRAWAIDVISARP